MPSATEVTRLLDDIESRQQQVIEELDALIVRIEAVIAEWTEPGKQLPPVRPIGAATEDDDARVAGAGEAEGDAMPPTISIFGEGSEDEAAAA